MSSTNTSPWRGQPSRLTRRPRATALAGLLATVLAAGTPGPAAAQAPATATPPSTPFLPDTVLSPPRTPRLVRLPAPGDPVVALRLSIPLREGPAEAGAGRLLQMLAVDRARALATPVGARVEGLRTPWGLAYTVVGAAADVDYLAYLLRRAVAEPSEDRITLDRLRARLLQEVRRQDETPDGRILAALRRESAPDVPPLAGTVGTLPLVTMGTLRDLWARTHQAEDMTLVVAGDVPPEVLLVSFQGIGAPAERRAEPPIAAAPPPDRNRAQVIRQWYGEARTIDDGRDPRTTVAAVLLADHLHGLGAGIEAQVQLWQVDGRRILALMGAALPRDASRMRQAIRSATSSVAEDLSPERVAGAVAAVREEILLNARTPAGRAGFVGSHLDAAGEPGAAAAFLAALERIRPDDMGAFLTGLAEGTPVRAEVRP